MKPLDVKTIFNFRGKRAYEVREIRDERVKRGKIEYHVHWKGYPSEDATWEPEENINQFALNNYFRNLKKNYLCFYMII